MPSTLSNEGQRLKIASKQPLGVRPLSPRIGHSRRLLWCQKLTSVSHPKVDIRIAYHFRQNEGKFKI